MNETLILTQYFATSPFMLSLGATIEKIAEALSLDIEQVRQVAQSSQSYQSQAD
ncbi:hypothetical protein H6G74_23915 [Nostoc spongiaeforme FACHB-130]|uniref:Uncharacterized protein n=1 Tax=Nostoc spongiaeforme FACHB-130 TaxID=1357510 RepID=A0ABR8G2D2_9NOSO|nr:hypothetical protein [Nostoc spongiaeforme]MBD2597342.1 hypothetical protein [Nostoc spongiaeforme FACHB-130]